MILAWADTFHDRTGDWPKATSGPITDHPQETWNAVQLALYTGARGLTAGSSLARLLARERGVRNQADRPPLSVPDILRWADAYHARHGKWPKCGSGPIPETLHDTWLNVHEALYKGLRGLSGGSSLARLLAFERGARNIKNLSPLCEQQILMWADAYHARTGLWPNNRSGPIPEASGENWQGIQNALHLGSRGFPGGSSITRLLVQFRGIRNRKNPPPLTTAQILTWADNHRARTDSWPSENSGPVAEAPGETWLAISQALRKGTRGLPGGSSLARLLAEKTAVITKQSLSEVDA